MSNLPSISPAHLVNVTGGRVISDHGRTITTVLDDKDTPECHAAKAELRRSAFEQRSGRTTMDNVWDVASRALRACGGHIKDARQIRVASK